MMINRFNFSVCMMLFLLLTGVASAQVASGGNYRLEQSIIPGGGGTSTDGGTLRLDGTIGQSVAGASTGTSSETGATYTLGSGFVPAAFEPAAPPPPLPQPNPQPGGGTLLISEFRLQGATSTTDEYIEIYNNTSVPRDISGFRLQASNGFTLVVPANTTLAARAHYLFANTGSFGGYSLTAYATPDQTYAADLPADAGLAIVNPSGQVVDAVGFAQSVFAEGAPLVAATPAAEHAFVRRYNLADGTRLDSGDNAADFRLVAPDPVMVAGSQLGAPAPENSSAPILSNGRIKISLLNPFIAPSSSPNRVRDARSTATNAEADCRTRNLCAKGTLSVQRTYTNNTGGRVTRLRLRIIDVTTLNSPGYSSSTQADLRVLSSSGTVRDSSGATIITVSGVTLDEPPAQGSGGGLNSSLTLDLSQLNGGTGLDANQSVSIQLLLSVERAGRFSIFFNVEALPGF